MAHINLLPWRENLRKQRKRDFGFQMLGALIVTLLALVYWHMHVQGMIDHQESRNNLLKREIAAVDKKIEEIKELEKTRSQLISRMDVIQNLQISRPQIVHLFDELVETVPEGAYLEDLSQTGDVVTINGTQTPTFTTAQFTPGPLRGTLRGLYTTIQRQKRFVITPIRPTLS